MSLPQGLRCEICHGLLHRAVRTPCCSRRSCRGCAVKFITRERRCWGCNNTNIRTEALRQDQAGRQAVQTFSKTPVTSGSAENKSSPQNCQHIGADFDKNDSGTKRDNDGEAVKKTSKDDQICETVGKTNIYCKANNIVLVKLSLEEDQQVVRIVFSRDFQRLLRAQICLLSDDCLEQKTEVTKHNGNYYALIHLSIKHVSAEKQFSLYPGFHIANFSKLGRSQGKLANKVAEMKLQSELSLSSGSGPTLCRVLLSRVKMDGVAGDEREELSNLSSHVITEFLPAALDLLQVALTPLTPPTAHLPAVAQILVENNCEGTVSLPAGQCVGKVANSLGAANIEKIANLQNCSNIVGNTDRSEAQSESAETRKELAEIEKIEGNKLFEVGLYSAAITRYTAAIELVQSNPSYYSNRAACYQHLDLPSKALQDSLKSVEIEPSYAKGWMKAAQCCILLGKIDRAKKMCQKLLELSPNLSPLIELEREKIKTIEKANCEFLKESEAGNISRALYHLGRISALCPKFEKNHRFRAELHAMKGDLDMCREILATNCCPDNPEVMYVRALLLYYEDNLEEAAALLEKILSEKSGHQQSGKLLNTLREMKGRKEAGNGLFKEGKYEEAMQEYRSALKLDKFHLRVNAKLHCNLAACLIKLGARTEAIDECSAAIKNDKKYQKAFLRRAQTFMETGSYDQAVNDYSQLRGLDPTNPEYARLLTEAQAKLVSAAAQDLYGVLGVGRQAGAEEIRGAYRRAALSHHPDRHTLAEENTKTFHLRKFQEVGEAYSVLADPAKRSLYDQGRLYQSIPAQQARQARAEQEAAVAQAAQAWAAAVRASLYRSQGVSAGQGIFASRPGAPLAPGFVFLRPPGAPSPSPSHPAFHFVNSQTSHSQPRYGRF